MKVIILTQGQVAIVDDDDFEKLNAFKWQAKKYRKTYYAARSIRLESGKQRTINMHRAILNCPDGLEIDHVDGNGLNNQRYNIRVVTRRQNHQNLHRQSSSKYPGVWHDKDANRWHSSIRIGPKIKNLGRYGSEVEAFKAYAKAVHDLGDRILEGVAEI